MNKRKFVGNIIIIFISIIICFSLINIAEARYSRHNPRYKVVFSAYAGINRSLDGTNPLTYTPKCYDTTSSTPSYQDDLGYASTADIFIHDTTFDYASINTGDYVVCNVTNSPEFGNACYLYYNFILNTSLDPQFVGQYNLTCDISIYSPNATHYNSSQDFVPQEYNYTILQPPFDQIQFSINTSVSTNYSNEIQLQLDNNPNITLCTNCNSWYGNITINLNTSNPDSYHNITIYAHNTTSYIWRRTRFFLNIGYKPNITLINIPQTAKEGDNITINFTADDLDNNINYYAIYRDNQLLTESNQYQWNTTYTDAGTYNFTFIVCDSDNLCDNKSRIITINNTPCKPNITTINIPTTADAGDNITINFTADDLDNNINYYAIYRDNQLLTESNQYQWNTTYTDAGTYNFTFIVCDEDNLCDNKSRIITINPTAELYGSNSYVTKTNPLINERIYFKFILKNPTRFDINNITIYFDSGQTAKQFNVSVSSYGQSIIITSQLYTTTGTYNPEAIIDYGNNIPEIDETNNTIYFNTINVGSKIRKIKRRILLR